MDHPGRLKLWLHRLNKNDPELHRALSRRLAERAANCESIASKLADTAPLTELRVETIVHEGALFLAAQKIANRGGELDGGGVPKSG
ncbi:hypothetical protein [Mesorhizobium sp. WSM2561]|uniref:hypothetical protein n=1 Tax=Mesorhizobium sp. WSM2561 TaxID=1040985 RepID=UPI00048815EE|nr:hypothetical protein [Mesorhizobium sp. WSM2561]